MTGVLQTHARKYDLPIDQLKMDFAVNKTFLMQEEIQVRRLRGEKVSACSFRF